VPTTDALDGTGSPRSSALPVGVVAIADARRTGHVVAFDERRGVGIVATTVGERLPFHCVALRDGTRTVAIGTPVRCLVAAGVLGRWEAAAIATDRGIDAATDTREAAVDAPVVGAVDPGTELGSDPGTDRGTDRGPLRT
jgi:hypothetical protein